MHVDLRFLLLGSALVSTASAFPFFHLRRSSGLDPTWQTGSDGSSCDPNKDLFACDGKLFLVCKAKGSDWSWTKQRTCDSNCMDEITTKALCKQNAASGWTPDSSGGPAVTRESGGNQGWATTKANDNNHQWTKTQPADTGYTSSAPAYSAGYTQPPSYGTQTLPYCTVEATSTYAYGYNPEATSTYAYGYNPGNSYQSTQPAPYYTQPPSYGQSSQPPPYYQSTQPAGYGGGYSSSTASGYYVQTCIPYPTSTTSTWGDYQPYTSAVATETPYEAPRYAGNSCVEPSVVWCQESDMLVCSDSYKWHKMGSCDCSDKKWANACP
ncbi:hypothetical protein BDZ88DRAFT_407448 [Geranomyces variabilis]|nr:hypothetical protein BDZ88DRAFT_407448 [Geranomyces variabilis]KAJ3142446.1 hypothetical protein HDU90_004720 [Geranomyces variabilis]